MDGSTIHHKGRGLTPDLRTMSVAEMVEASGIPATTIRRLINDGFLRNALPIGYQRGKRVKASEFQAFIDGRGETA